MLVDLLIGTFRSLRAHALRFTLTSLGIVWGIAMLTYLSAMNDGFDRHFHAQIAKVGEKIVFVFPGVILKDRVGGRGARRLELELEDVDRISQIHAVERAAPNIWLLTRIFRAGRRTKLVWTFGRSEQSAEIRSFEVAEGRFISRRDVDESAKVVFLGASVKERLFGNAPALGRRLQIESLPFRVIGVAKPKGYQIISMGPPDDEQASIPVTTAQRWFSRSDKIGDVIFAPVTREMSWGATDHVRAMLGRHHGFRPDEDAALGIFNVQEAMQIVELLGLGIRIFLTSASLITLLVGAVGVMNIMLVVVTERIKEIGLRKAIGASSGAIFVEFLAETLAITLGAGLVGAVLGWLAVQAGTVAAIQSGNAMNPVPILLPGTFALILVSIIGVGLVAGILPAVRAARVEPAISLRAL